MSSTDSHNNSLNDIVTKTNTIIYNNLTKIHDKLTLIQSNLIEEEDEEYENFFTRINIYFSSIVNQLKLNFIESIKSIEKREKILQKENINLKKTLAQNEKDILSLIMENMLLKLENENFKEQSQLNTSQIINIYKSDNNNFTTVSDEDDVIKDSKIYNKLSPQHIKHKIKHKKVTTSISNMNLFINDENANKPLFTYSNNKSGKMKKKMITQSVIQGNNNVPHNSNNTSTNNSGNVGGGNVSNINTNAISPFLNFCSAANKKIKDVLNNNNNNNNNTYGSGSKVKKSGISISPTRNTKTSLITNNKEIGNSNNNNNNFNGNGITMYNNYTIYTKNLNNKKNQNYNNHQHAQTKSGCYEYKVQNTYANQNEKSMCNLPYHHKIKNSVNDLSINLSGGSISNNNNVHNKVNNGVIINANNNMRSRNTQQQHQLNPKRTGNSMNNIRKNPNRIGNGLTQSSYNIFNNFKTMFSSINKL